MILQKVTTAENVWFAIIGFLIMDSNLKILYAMVLMIWQCVNISGIAVITFENVEYRPIIHNIIKSAANNLIKSSE